MHLPASAASGFSTLLGCDAPARVFDVALVDLDGVVYIGDEPVAHAAEALADAVRGGMRLEFVTNNALRTPIEVAAKLARVGVEAAPDQVTTSAQAAARLLAERLPGGARVLVAGGRGLRVAVAEAGFTVVDSAEAHPDAVALGFDPTLDYARLAEASLAVRRGALFVAANRDATVPTPRGPMPGMGALTALVVTATGSEPLVAGKPELALHTESVRRSGALNPIIVGDRLDTDIEGARRADVPGLLVLTGVTDVDALVRARPSQRPMLIADDLRGLLRSHPPAARGRCGTARARYVPSTRRVLVESDAGSDRPCGAPSPAAGATARSGNDRAGSGSGDQPGDRLDALRAVLTAAWDAADGGHRVEGIDGLPV